MDFNKFWNDDGVREMNPSEKLFYLYLHTSPKAQEKTYEISTLEISNHTGFSVDVINVLIRRFEYEYGLITYSNGLMQVGGLHG